MLQKRGNTRWVRFLKAWREHPELQQSDVAAKTGVKESNLSAYINGKVKATNPFLDKFYTVYGIQEDKILITDEDYNYIKITGKVEKPATNAGEELSGEDYKEKYFELLEEVSVLKSKLIDLVEVKASDLNLKGLSAAQISIQHRLDVLFLAFAHVAAQGDKKKAVALMKEWDKQSSSMGKEKLHRGNATDGHTVGKQG